jgi:hypothetical protein
MEPGGDAEREDREKSVEIQILGDSMCNPLKEIAVLFALLSAELLLLLVFCVVLFLSVESKLYFSFWVQAPKTRWNDL